MVWMQFLSQPYDVPSYCMGTHGTYDMQFYYNRYHRHISSSSNDTDHEKVHTHDGITDVVSPLVAGAFTLALVVHAG